MNRVWGAFSGTLQHAPSNKFDHATHALPANGDKVLSKISVLLADDREDVLETVARLLQPEFEVVGTVTNGKSLIYATERLKPDIVIVDISMPVLNGFEAVRRLRESSTKTQFVFLTIHESSDYVAAALAAGALGYVVKSRLATDLSVAIKEANAGRSFLSPSNTPDV